MNGQPTHCRSGRPLVRRSWNRVGGVFPDNCRILCLDQLAMFLFLFIAITATIGTVIQQESGPTPIFRDTAKYLSMVLAAGLHRCLSPWWFPTSWLLASHSLTCFLQGASLPCCRSMKPGQVSVSLAFIKA